LGLQKVTGDPGPATASDGCKTLHSLRYYAEREVGFQEPLATRPAVILRFQSRRLSAAHRRPAAERLPVFGGESHDGSTRGRNALRKPSGERTNMLAGPVSPRVQGASLANPQLGAEPQGSGPSHRATMAHPPTPGYGVGSLTNARLGRALGPPGPHGVVYVRIEGSLVIANRRLVPRSLRKAGALIALGAARPAHASCAWLVNGLEAENCLRSVPGSAREIDGAGDSTLLGCLTLATGDSNETRGFTVRNALDPAEWTIGDRRQVPRSSRFAGVARAVLPKPRLSV